MSQNEASVTKKLSIIRKKAVNIWKYDNIPPNDIAFQSI